MHLAVLPVELQRISMIRKNLKPHMQQHLVRMHIESIDQHVVYATKIDEIKFYAAE